MTERLITCRGCKQELSSDHFFPSWITATTTMRTCCVCAKKQAKTWEEAHPDYRKSERVKQVGKNWRANNNAKLREAVNQWRKDHPEEWKTITKRCRRKTIQTILIRNRQREILEVTAMPPWADRKKIQAIYLEAKRLTRETGIKHEVDHFYPLRGRISCGLHVEYNLRIITSTENRKKFNKMPEEIAC